MLMQQAVTAAFGNGLDAFVWDRRDPQLAPSISQFVNPRANSHRDVHPSVLAEQMLGTSSLPRELGRYDNITTARITRRVSACHSLQYSSSSISALAEQRLGTSLASGFLCADMSSTAALSMFVGLA